MTRLLMISFIALVMAAASSPVVAQTGGGHDLAWSTLDAGGGTSSGSGFEVSGTIGQPDAGRMSLSTTSITGGFWAIIGRCSGPVYVDRGDANADCALTVADVFYLVNNLFAGGAAPLASGDANADSSVTVADVFYLVNHLFAGGPPPPP